MVEENHTRSKSTASDGQMLYTHDDLGRGHRHGCGNGGGMAEEEVDEVHNSLIPGSKKVETAKGIPAKRELPPACINQVEPANRVRVLWKA